MARAPRAILLLVLLVPGGCFLQRHAIRPDPMHGDFSYVRLDWGDMHFDRGGILPAPGEPTVVLLPGFGASLLSWNDVIADLRREFDVVRLDLRGQGYSDKPDDDRYEVTDQVDTVIDAMTRLGLGDVILVGHSYGGGIALQLALRDRDRAQGPRLAGLVLVAAASYRQTPPWFIRVARNALLRRLGDTFTTAEFRTRRLLNDVFHNRSRVDAERVARHARFLKLPGASRAIERIAERIVPADIDAISARYSAITQPTMVIWGSNDTTIRPDRPTPGLPQPEFAWRLAQEIPGAQRPPEIIESCGHAPQEECPAEFLRRLLPFLRTTAAASRAS